MRGLDRTGRRPLAEPVSSDCRRRPPSASGGKGGQRGRRRDQSPEYPRSRMWAVARTESVERKIASLAACPGQTLAYLNADRRSHPPLPRRRSSTGTACCRLTWPRACRGMAQAGRGGEAAEGYSWDRNDGVSLERRERRNRLL
jgi:hypothetical protein